MPPLLLMPAPILLVTPVQFYAVRHHLAEFGFEGQGETAGIATVIFSTRKALSPMMPPMFTIVDVHVTARTAPMMIRLMQMLIFALRVAFMRLMHYAQCCHGVMPRRCPRWRDDTPLV